MISIGSYEKRSELLLFRRESPEELTERHWMRISFISATILYHMKRRVSSSFLCRKRWKAEGAHRENKIDRGERTEDDDSPCGFLDQIIGDNGTSQSPTESYHRKIWEQT